MSQLHPLVQDAHNADATVIKAVHHDMRADEIGEVRGWEVAAVLAALRIAADGLQRAVDLVLVGLQLPFASAFAGVPQNVNEVLSCPSR